MAVERHMRMPEGVVSILVAVLWCGDYIALPEMYYQISNIKFLAGQLRAPAIEY
jgi:hypothetical protein